MDGIAINVVGAIVVGEHDLLYGIVAQNAYTHLLRTKTAAQEQKV